MTAAGLVLIDELAHLTGQLNFHEFVAEDLAHGQQRTKLDHYADHFHVAVHDCELLGDLDEPTAQVELVTLCHQLGTEVPVTQQCEVNVPQVAAYERHGRQRSPVAGASASPRPARARRTPTSPGRNTSGSPRPRMRT